MSSEWHNAPLKLPRWIVVLRAVQTVFAFLILVLTAFAASVLAKGYYTEGFIPGWGLTWFTCIWTFLFLAYILFGRKLVPAPLKPAIIALALELATAFWWLVSMAVLAAEVPDVYNIRGVEYMDSDGYSTTYYENPYGRRGTAAVGSNKAAAVFSGFEFGLFLVTLGMHLLAAIQARNGGKGRGLSHEARPEVSSMA